MLCLETDLITIANDPFGPLPESYASFVATVGPDELEMPHTNQPNRLELYERQIRFDSFEVLLSRLEEACSAFPALEPRLAPLKQAVARRVDLQGPAYLYYTGCCVSGSPESRAADDLQVRNSMVTNLLSLWKAQVDVFRVNLPPLDIDPYGYRAARVWQLEEHTIVAVRYPLNLNSAPGGFLHDYAIDVHDPSPLPPVPRDPVPASTADAVRRHMEGMHSAYASQPGPSARIDPGALDHQIDAATPRYLLLGRVPMVAVGKDVTVEDYRGDHSEVGYRQRLAGPGPQATNAGLLYQHGVDPATATTNDRLEVLPPFTDLFTVIDRH